MSQGKMLFAEAGLRRISAGGGLTRQVWPVTHLEATNRLGGRCRRPAFPPGVTVPHRTTRPAQMTSCGISVPPSVESHRKHIFTGRMTGRTQ